MIFLRKTRIEKPKGHIQLFYWGFSQFPPIIQQKHLTGGTFVTQTNIELNIAGKGFSI